MALTRFARDLKNERTIGISAEQNRSNSWRIGRILSEPGECHYAYGSLRQRPCDIFVIDRNPPNAYPFGSY